jgi:gas vesicle protein
VLPHRVLGKAAQQGGDRVNSRLTKGLLYGGLIGAAIGAYWMLKIDRSTEKMLLERDRQMRQSARHTVVAFKDGARRMGSAWQSGKGAVKAGWQALRN